MSYHVTSFEDPIEGKVLVSLVESTSNAKGGRVVKGSPPQILKPWQSIPLQPIHPLLLT